MLILEKPYVSETLIRTAVEKNYPVLRNAVKLSGRSCPNPLR